MKRKQVKTKAAPYRLFSINVFGGNDGRDIASRYRGSSSEETTYRTRVPKKRIREQNLQNTDAWTQRY